MPANSPKATKNTTDEITTAAEPLIPDDAQVVDSTENPQKLLNLVEYLDHLFRLGEKPVFSLKHYKELCLSELELKGQLGITHNLTLEDEPVWLSIDRLKRSNPPVPPEELRDWIALSNDPSHLPHIKNLFVRTLTKAESDALVQSGNAKIEDISSSPKSSDELPLSDVILRIENHPEIERAANTYINKLWLPWSEKEKPIRKSISIYDQLFGFYQMVQVEGAEKPLELVWGVGVGRWRVRGYELDHPLIEQLVEVEVHPTTASITIRPRSNPPQLAIKPYQALEIESADRVLAFARSFFDSLPDNKEFSPFDSSLVSEILRYAATNLDSAGRYFPDHGTDIHDRKLPPIESNLVISDTWAIYARQRSRNLFIEDLERLKKAVEKAETLPGAARKFVETPSDEAAYVSRYIDLSSNSLNISGTGTLANTAPEDTVADAEYFFPKPFNQDQISIIQRLEKADGVVVQGPPGTGKTHTIANIICHSLATGKKVLVTSKGEAALSVLRDQIPEGIRDLTISLLTSEREGLKQLERTVGLLASTSTKVNARRVEGEIVAGQNRILELRARLKKIDAELSSFASKHLSKVSFMNGDPLLPVDLAQHVLEGRSAHSWLPDSPNLDARFDPQFTAADIASLEISRRAVGNDLDYLNATLPRVADLPTEEVIKQVHEDLRNSKKIEQVLSAKNAPRLQMSTSQVYPRAEALLSALSGLQHFLEDLENTPTLNPLFVRWSTKGISDEAISLLDTMLSEIRGLRRMRKDALLCAVHVPSVAVSDLDVCQAIQRCSEGSRAFGILQLGKSIAKDHLRDIRVDGREPASSEDWKKVNQYINLRSRITATVSKWNAIANDCLLPMIKDEGDQTAKWLVDTEELIQRLRSAATHDCPFIRGEISALFIFGFDQNPIQISVEYCSRLIDALEANLALVRLESARDRLAKLSDQFSKSPFAVNREFLSFCENDIGALRFDTSRILHRWNELNKELARIHSLKTHFDTVARVSDLIQASGGEHWAKGIRAEPPGDADTWANSKCLESWHWSRLNSHLRAIDGRQRIKDLAALRLKTEDEIANEFGEVVKLRTFLGLKLSISPSVEAALNMFVSALRHIGHGTGIRAARFRTDARNAMEKSYSAIPCWIMPTWRISESLPSTLGSFDLVIIDEASQSDITSLPAILRGKKVLVVGDDKQVSPSAAFVEEKKLLQLRHNYLKDQPFGPLMLPGSSLYELAQAVFPGKRIMLHEHFRCVEPIIRFSCQFYSEPILPVRIPKPSERLNPPLIDVYVPHGSKDKRKVNVAEAEAIVNEIARIVKLPETQNRSIGVVSLLGDKQAHFIQSKLLETIGEESFLRHSIACGDSATFQGKERDIMFVSMVECPETRQSKTSLPFQQRFNVAMSRARDRMYLFRSVTEEMLKPEDLKARVIRHFRDPMATTKEFSRDPLELCDSDFERAVLSWLLARNYRAVPQVKVGPFSIDIVIEGSNDARLAVELDGDKYHTPERWADDLARQRVLERMGWRFWRCWGSSFILDPDSCLADLVATLKQLGIDPGLDSLDSVSYSEFRIASQIVRPEPESVNIEDEQRVEVGDRLVVSFADQPTRQFSIVLSNNETDEAMRVFAQDHPVARALIGAGADDEIELNIEGKLHLVSILSIQKHTAVM